MQQNSGQFRAADHAGKVINDAEVLVPTTERDSGGYTIWRLRCLLCNKEFVRPASSIVRKSTSHLCPEWWAKHGASRNLGRPPIPNSGAHVNLIFAHYQTSARKRRIPFNLTKSEARTLFEKPCYYCGAAPSLRHKHPSLPGKYSGNGIDRIVNTEGYTLANCVPCCKMCNWAKSNKSLAEFKTWIERVYRHLCTRRPLTLNSVN